MSPARLVVIDDASLEELIIGGGDVIGGPVVAICNVMTFWHNFGNI